ncbi:MAG: hypothetical protein NC393_07985 [Clostridium sp.]|nr:hypothetical protein [Clostridium sp.]
MGIEKKKLLNFPTSYVILGIGKAPTPKWMLPKRLFCPYGHCLIWCRQVRHFYFFLLFLLSRKVRNATIKLPKEISKPIIPMNIKIISAAVILRTSLPMYSQQARAIGSGGYHPVMGTLLVALATFIIISSITQFFN